MRRTRISTFSIFLTPIVALGLIASMATSAVAQNAGDIINLFGGLMQGAIAQANQAEWRKLSQGELSCVDQALRQNGSNLQIAMRQGVTPSDPRIATIRENCRAIPDQDISSDRSLYYVANTQPPDAYLSLRTNPSSSIGQRIMTMPNGTALRVLRRQEDGWWYVTVVASGQQGWALSRYGNRVLIECCAVATGDQADNRPQTQSPVSNPTSVIAPSFDCAKATYPDERAICSNPELAQLDNILVDGYEYVRQKYGDQYARTINAPLFQARRACGSDPVCVKDRQLFAINKFQSLGAPIKATQTNQDGQLLWDLNGSTLYLVSKGRSRKFFYKAPRAAMQSLGVKPGSVLFEGEAIGDQYRGIAYFSSRCGRLPVSVVGPILDNYRRVELSGRTPSFDGNCRMTGYVENTLSLQLIEPSPVIPPGISMATGSQQQVTTEAERPNSNLFKSTKEKALGGDAVAQTELGSMYANGNGTQKNLSEAITWFRKAADQGDAQAQEKLGDAYMFGLGVNEDNKEAAVWYTKAADQGFAAGQYKLGLMYDKGIGIEQSGPKASELIKKAASQGNQEAKTRLAEVAAIVERIKTISERISKHSSAVLNVARSKELQKIAVGLASASDSMTMSELKSVERDANSAVTIFDEAEEYKNISEIAKQRLALMDKALGKIYFDAPLIREIKETIVSAKKAITDADLALLKEALAKLDRIYDPNQLLRLKEAKEQGFDTIEAYDRYLADKAKLGRSGIVLKPH